MKKLIGFVFLSLILSCKKDKDTINEVSTKTKIIENELNTNWQRNFQLTHDIDKDSIWFKPVRFYTDNPNCDKTAIAFYFGKFRPSDNVETSRLLQLVVSKDSSLRPFYRWILDKTIQVQDGALGEYTGIPARKYAEKFPNEFFEFIDSDKSGKIYENWYNSILYSGFYEEDNYYKPENVRKNLEKTMKLNCKNCNEKLFKRIEKYALDCFPNSEK